MRRLEEYGSDWTANCSGRSIDNPLELLFRWNMLKEIWIIRHLLDSPFLNLINDRPESFSVRYEHKVKPFHRRVFLFLIDIVNILNPELKVKGNLLTDMAEARDTGFQFLESHLHRLLSILLWLNPGYILLKAGFNEQLNVSLIVFHIAKDGHLRIAYQIGKEGSLEWFHKFSKFFPYSRNILIGGRFPLYDNIAVCQSFHDFLDCL